MKTIKKVFRQEVGRYTQGTNFTFGDFIPTIFQIIAKTSSGESFELDRNKILNETGGSRVTTKKMDSLIGKNVDDFVKD